MVTSVNPTAVDVLYRCRRLASHLICESLGYFCPEAAANAIAARRASGTCTWRRAGPNAASRRCSPSGGRRCMPRSGAGGRTAASWHPTRRPAGW
jgi:hypothetical protein